MRTARLARNLSLTEDAATDAVLTQLRPLKNDAPTNAAVRLFGKEPQRFIYNSEVKCAHFHGTQRQKPIPFYPLHDRVGPETDNEELHNARAAPGRRRGLSRQADKGIACSAKLACSAAPKGSTSSLKS